MKYFISVLFILTFVATSDIPSDNKSLGAEAFPLNNITEVTCYGASEEHTVNALSSDSKQTRIVNGRSNVKKLADGEIPIRRQYTSAEEIPQEELNNWDQMFVFGPGHAMIHKTREFRRYYEKHNSLAWDVWVEYKGELGDRFYGAPFAHSVIKTGKSGGLVSVGRSQNYGKSIAGTAGMGFNPGILIFGASINLGTSFSLTAGYEVSIEASCSVPKDTQGGIFAFDSSVKFSFEQREWKVKKSYRKKPKYTPGKWTKHETAARSFGEPIFVCSVDQDYIKGLLSRMDNIQPSDDYTGFLKDASALI